MGLELSVKISATVKVQPKRVRETPTIERDLTLKLDIEDAVLHTLTSFNAESTVDQTKETSLLKLSLNAQANHGLLSSLRLEVNSK
jgi:hypothetical protein